MYLVVRLAQRQSDWCVTQLEYNSIVHAETGIGIQVARALLPELHTVNQLGSEGKQTADRQQGQSFFHSQLASHVLETPEWNCRPEYYVSVGRPCFATTPMTPRPCTCINHLITNTVNGDVRHSHKTTDVCYFTIAV